MKEPLKGRITSKFGNRIHPVSKAKSFHNGVDISAEIGTSIRCPWSGTVIKSDSKHEDTTDKGGIEVKVKHDNGYTTGYAHLSKSLVFVGDKVEEGEIIALTGNTGIGTGAHLHMTLRNEKDELINPASVFTFK